MINVAIMLQDGRSRPKDEARARSLFTKAVAAGIVKATFNLGIKLQDGRGRPKDPNGKKGFKQKPTKKLVHKKQD